MKQDLLNRKHVYALLQRSRDIFFSLLAIIVLSPLMLLTALLIVLDDPHGGPIFSQYRVGKNGRKFKLYKFRSMVVHAEDNLESLMQQNEMDGPVFKIKKDPRITRIGHFIRKTSIDELPQFINVLLGQMSVVGPRPHMLKHTEEYSRLIDKYMVRHLVKPGITGWAQVTGYRGETKELWQMEGRVQRDVWYLEHWTFLLDLYIIYKTIRNAIQGEKEAY